MSTPERIKHRPGRKKKYGDNSTVLFSRVSEELREKVEATAKKRGYTTLSGYIRETLEKDIKR